MIKPFTRRRNVSEKFGNFAPMHVNCLKAKGMNELLFYKIGKIAGQDMETVAAVCRRERWGNSQWIVCSGFWVSWHTPLLLRSVLHSRPPVGICNLKSPREIPRIFAFLFLLLSSCSPVKYCKFWFESIDFETFDLSLSPDALLPLWKEKCLLKDSCLAFDTQNNIIIACNKLLSVDLFKEN